MLALAFLVMIGMVLVADGFEVHVPKGFVYTAMAFAAAVEGLNLLAGAPRPEAATAAGQPSAGSAPFAGRRVKIAARRPGGSAPTSRAPA